MVRRIWIRIMRPWLRIPLCAADMRGADVAHPPSGVHHFQPRAAGLHCGCACVSPRDVLKVDRNRNMNAAGYGRVNNAWDEIRRIGKDVRFAADHREPMTDGCPDRDAARPV